MARFFTSGFEVNATAAGSEWYSYNGTVSIDGTTKRSGRYALRANPTSSTGYAEFIWKSNVVTTGNRYYRVYLYIATAPSVDANIMGEYGGSSDGFYVVLTTARTLELYGDTQLGSTGTTVLALNTWYRIEFEGKYSSSAVANELFIDGVSEITGSIAQSSVMDRFRCGISTSCTADLYFDDVSIADDAHTGAGNVVTIFPDADGDENTVTRNSGTNNYYTYIDDNPPDDATTYLICNATSEDLLVNMETMANAGASVVDSITIVHVGGKWYDQSIFSDARFKCLDGASTQVGTTILAGNGVYNAFVASGSNPVETYVEIGVNMTTKPSGGAWTEAAVDALQCGFEGVSVQFSHEFRVTTLWATIEYVEGTPAATGISNRTLTGHGRLRT